MSCTATLIITVACPTSVGLYKWWTSLAAAVARPIMTTPSPNSSQASMPSSSSAPPMRASRRSERREARMGGADEDEGMLAWLEFGDGVVMIGRATAAARDVHHLYSPTDVGHATVMINVAVHDIDSHYQHAVDQGANITMPIEDAFYGYRRYEADDLEGHHWHFHESLEAIRAREERAAG